MDQLTYGPVCNVLLISYLSLVVEGRSATATQQVTHTLPAVISRGATALLTATAHRQRSSRNTFVLTATASANVIDQPQHVVAHERYLCLQRLRRDYPMIQLNGWKLWPLAAFFNYRYVPLKLRVLFVNVVAFCWCGPNFAIPVQRMCRRKMVLGLNGCLELHRCPLSPCTLLVGESEHRFTFLCTAGRPSSSRGPRPHPP